MIARARRSRSWRSGSATEVGCRTCSCFIGLLPCFILRAEPENGETELSARIPLQLLHPGLDYQVYRFMGCDCHIEVLHRILKTGCHVEGCLLATQDRIVRYLVLCSIIAWCLFWLTHIARVAPQTPALCVLSKPELHVLRAVTQPPATGKPHLSTAKDIVLALARLGGFLNRKHDGTPGPTPIWRGWQLLQQLSLHFNQKEAMEGFTTYG
jgi:hypothetical protein